MTLYALHGVMVSDDAASAAGCQMTQYPLHGVAVSAVLGVMEKPRRSATQSPGVWRTWTNHSYRHNLALSNVTPIQTTSEGMIQYKIQPSNSVNARLVFEAR